MTDTRFYVPEPDPPPPRSVHWGWFGSSYTERTPSLEPNWRVKDRDGYLSPVKCWTLRDATIVAEALNELDPGEEEGEMDCSSDRVEYVEQAHQYHWSIKGVVVNHCEMVERFQNDDRSWYNQKVAAIVLKADSGEIKCLPLYKQYATITVKPVGRE